MHVINISYIPYLQYTGNNETVLFLHSSLKKEENTKGGQNEKDNI